MKTPTLKVLACIVWKDNEMSNYYIVEKTGAVAHYNMARIHPFDDGNGRGARLLMNLIFMKKGLPPAIIRNERRRLYLDTLAEADKGNLGPFVRFVGESLVSTQKVIVEAL